MNAPGPVPLKSPQPEPPTTFDRVLLVLEYSYLLRFPILSALLLAVGLPVGYYLAPAIFEGLFDAGGARSFGFVVWMEFQLAWTIMVTSRLVLVYGPCRLDSLKRLNWKVGKLRLWHVVCFGALALPTFYRTWMGSQDLEAWEKALAGTLGLLASIAVLAATAVIHFRLEHGGGRTAEMVLPTFGFLKNMGKEDKDWEKKRSWFWNGMDRFFGEFSDNVTAGLMRRGTSQITGQSKKWFRSGHELAFTAFVLLLVTYGAIGLGYAPGNASPERQPAALFYALFLFMLWTWFFYGVAFVIDRFRLPVLTTLLLLSLLTGLYRTDHYFRVTRTEKLPEVPPADVIADWNNGPRHGAGKPLIVVATAGGGIQASAWTARVLTGMQRECNNFASSLVLVSSVSGGSVGTMYALAPYDGKTGEYPAAQLDPARDRARRSSLSSVGWGLLYPDLLRTLPVIGWFVPQDFDRGTAIEAAWTWDWNEATAPPLMSQWRSDVSKGTRPAVIFNATASESGQQFLIGTTELTELKKPSGMQFGRAFTGWDMPVATAARQSAAFTYVSPIARASAANDEKDRVHLADGGYYDNSGLVSALAWLREARSSLNGRTVIVMTIDSVSKDAKTGEAWSWQKQMVAPVTTIMNMRTSSQQYRGGFETDLIEETLNAGGATVVRAPFLYEGKTQPLSWHLTKVQKENIEEAWRKPSDGVLGAKKAVFEQVGCRVGSQVASR